MLFLSIHIDISNTSLHYRSDCILIHIDFWLSNQILNKSNLGIYLEYFAGEIDTEVKMFVLSN